MANKRKKDATSSRPANTDAADADAAEASHEVSSHDNMSRFLTRDDMDKIMVELRDHMTSQGKVLERQQQLMDHLLGRLETGLNASTSIPPSTEAGAITDLRSARNQATDQATP